MHYKNGREAKPGDTVIWLNGTYSKVGILHSLQPGSDTCNGKLAQTTNSDLINIKDCIHIEDVDSSKKG